MQPLAKLRTSIPPTCDMHVTCTQVLLYARCTVVLLTGVSFCAHGMRVLLHILAVRCDAWCWTSPEPCCQLLQLLLRFVGAITSCTGEAFMDLCTIKHVTKSIRARCVIKVIMLGRCIVLINMCHLQRPSQWFPEPAWLMRMRCDPLWQPSRGH